MPIFNPSYKGTFICGNQIIRSHPNTNFYQHDLLFVNIYMNIDETILEPKPNKNKPKTNKNKPKTNKNKNKTKTKTKQKQNKTKTKQKTALINR